MSRSPNQTNLFKDLVHRIYVTVKPIDEATEKSVLEVMFIAATTANYYGTL